MLAEPKETRPKDKWGSVQEYILYLKQSAAYEFAGRFVVDKKVLEIGCGAGYGADYISNFASDVVAIDISETNIAYCRAKYPKDNVFFMVSDATELPFEADQFDVVMSFQVIEHIEPKLVRMYLSEIKRVLRSRGTFICTTPNKKLRLLPFQKPWNPEHKKEYDHKELNQLLKSVFSRVEIMGLRGRRDVETIERNRVRQNPLHIYLILPSYRLLRRILPSLANIIRREILGLGTSRQQNSLPENHSLMEKYSVNDFRVDRRLLQGCLDIVAMCAP